MRHPDQDFADHCCELLAPLGRCLARRMFGGWGLSVDGMTVAIIANLGDGTTLWLKADEVNRVEYENAHCPRFTYPVKGKAKSMNYYGAPADTLESPALMLPWARRAMEAALRSHNAPKKRKPRP